MKPDIRYGKVMADWKCYEIIKQANQAKQCYSETSFVEQKELLPRTPHR